MEFWEGFEPVSPTGQYFNSSVLSISVISVLESEVPINDMQTMSLVKDVFLPFQPTLFLHHDTKGEKQWKRVEVKLEDHVNVPIFPSGLSPTSYDEYLDDYISRIAMDHFRQSKPLWEIHMFQYPTSNAAGNIIFKLHHALGDGYSLMGALLSCLQRADNPSLPLKFTSHQRSAPESHNIRSICGTVTRISSLIYNTISDFGWSILKSSFVEDDQTPIRSADEAVEFRPITISTMRFSLDHIKSIKAKLGVTINDVITSMIFLGARLYMQEMSYNSSKADSTGIVLMNTRMVGGYKSVKEMLKPDSDGPWGNRFGLLHLSIPKFTDFDSSSNPLEFVWKTHKLMKKKRNSLAVLFTSSLLNIMQKLRGPEAAAGYIYKAISNSSMAISNIRGPVEQMALANHPIKGLYFMSVGVPQSLNITMMTYMGNVRVSLGSEKDFIDPNKFKLCVENAFEMILKATHELPTRE